MSEHLHISEAFLEKVQAAYYAAEPVITEVLHEQKELKLFLSMWRVAMELSEEDASAAIEQFTRLIKHMDTMAGLLLAYHGLAKMVNAVLTEHQE